MEIGSRPFIIAEMSGNHNGDLATALALIAAASNAGCDAVKIQLYKPEDLHDPDNNAIYEKYQIPRDWLFYLFAKAQDCKIPLFSSVFAPWAIMALERVRHKCPAYKLASPESTRLPDYTYMRLADAIHATGKTFIASTGRKDITTMQMLRPDILMYCIPGYPATITDDDIDYFKTWGFTAFSDHTADIASPLRMIEAGAKVIEKHFKLDDNCCDAAFSLNPEQMAELCRIAHR